MAAAPLMSWYLRRVTDRSDEPLGVLALLTAVVLLGGSFHTAQARAKVALHPLRLLIGALLLALLQRTPLAHFPLISGLLAVAVLGLSVEVPIGKAGVLALLVLSLPLVASLDFYAGYPLRLVASQITVLLLNLGGLGVERVGVLLREGGSIVGMDPPCAGVRMLWSACFTAAVVATWQRFLWPRTLLLLAGAVVCVVLGNSVRATLVFFPESGRVHWPEWMHPGVGLVVHGVVLAAVFGMGDALAGRRFRRDATHWSRTPAVARFVKWRGWVAAVMLALGALLAWRMTDSPRSPADAPHLASWPATLDGLPLVSLPLSVREARFAQAFPGHIAKFRCGDAEVILRRVTAPTRYMHPSSDCLRGAGFEVTSKPMHEDADGRLWGCSLAERANEKWRVRERYVNAAQNLVCTDASAWFWEAVMHSDEGPWMAITIMERAPDASATVAAK
jgi:exosortase/archaeosortase family protein